MKVDLFLEVISIQFTMSISIFLCQHVDVNSRCRDFKALVQRKVSGQKQRAVQSPEYSKIYGEVIDRYFIASYLFRVSYKLRNGKLADQFRDPLFSFCFDLLSAIACM